MALRGRVNNIRQTSQTYEMQSNQLPLPKRNEHNAGHDQLKTTIKKKKKKKKTQRAATSQTNTRTISLERPVVKDTGGKFNLILLTEYKYCPQYTENKPQRERNF